MSKSFRDSARSERFYRGGGAGRNPGDEKSERPLGGIVGFLFGGGDRNVSGAGYKSKRAPKRGWGAAKDTKHPKKGTDPRKGKR